MTLEFKQFIGMKLRAAMITTTIDKKGLQLIFEDNTGLNHQAIPVPIYEVKSPDYNMHISMLNDRESQIAQLQEVIKNLNKEIASKTKIIALYKSLVEELEKP